MLLGGRSRCRNPRLFDIGFATGNTSRLDDPTDLLVRTVNGTAGPATRDL